MPLNIASAYGRTCYYYVKLVCLPLSWAPVWQILPTNEEIERNITDDQTSHCGIEVNDVLNDLVNENVLLCWREDRIAFTDSCTHMPKEPYPFLGSDTCPSIGQVSQSITFHMDELL